MATVVRPTRTRKAAAAAAVKKEASPDPPAPDVKPGKMKVAELRQALEERGLETSGKKAELVARLEAALTTGGKEEEEEEGKGGSPSKKVKLEEEVKEETDFSKAMRALKSAPAKKKQRQAKVDSLVPMAGTYKVLDDWDCMLNQTNIGQNNNKYYVIQLLTRVGGQLYVWTRWGRVGEPGQHAMKGPLGREAAEKEFKKKFSDKTRNKWEEREAFTPAPGKYTLIEMDDDDEDNTAEVHSKLAALEETDGPAATVRDCTLEKPTQALVKLLFDNDMFNDAMKSMDIDTKKMPLGKLSKIQIAKGFEALEGIETALNQSAPRSKLAELTSSFYTIVPHDFGRRVPPPITDHETLQKKFDMLLVLGDIELAQGLKLDQVKKEKEAVDEVPHPLDVSYSQLKAELSHVKKSDQEYKVIEKYLEATAPQWRKLSIVDVWRVDREGEDERFRKHEGLANRKLLWHGTNVAVVAAILKSGLRIMPHSGGRVGKGIYFASENSKSAGYVRCTSSNIGIMFLNEVALGMEHHITRDDWTLTSPPSGKDCIIAKGRTEPDPKLDTRIKVEGREVSVPQGPPVTQAPFTGSSFSQSEYLVYEESQARIRYLLKLHFQ